MPIYSKGVEAAAVFSTDKKSVVRWISIVNEDKLIWATSNATTTAAIWSVRIYTKVTSPLTGNTLRFWSLSANICHSPVSPRPPWSTSVQLSGSRTGRAWRHPRPDKPKSTSDTSVHRNYSSFMLYSRKELFNSLMIYRMRPVASVVNIFIFFFFFSFAYIKS